MNIIGLAGVRVDRNYIAGSAGNASIIGFTHAMGAHALDEGMRVLGVCPGAVQTERITTMLKTRAKDEKGDENRWQDYFSGMPLNRPALVEEVADVVVAVAVVAGIAILVACAVAAIIAVIAAVAIAFAVATTRSRCSGRCCRCRQG